MEEMTGLAPGLVALALGVGFLAGLLKGCIGFGLPTVMIAGLSLIVAPDVGACAHGDRAAGGACAVAGGGMPGKTGSG